MKDKLANERKYKNKLKILKKFLIIQVLFKFLFVVTECNLNSWN